MKDYAIKSFITIKHKFKVYSSKLRPREYSPKVFCIGYNKTGTTSLGKAFEILGYKNSSFNQVVWRNYFGNGDIEKILNYTARFDSVDDLPWLKEEMIPVLDEKFPGSKFVYLERDENSWKNSIYHWTFKKTGIYPDIDQKWTEFEAHRDFVFKYFENRINKDLIVLDIKDQTGFKKLAEFLGKESVMDKFPHFNKT